MIHVISTGLNTAPTAKKACIDSAAQQTRLREHHIHDASEWDAPRAHFDYLVRVIADLDPHDIVISLDLDDHFSTPDALAIIERAHDLGAWMTYGSFKYSDGRTGFAAQSNSDTCRKDPWVMTHTKSFRAGLFKRIKVEHLKMNGEWLPHARDLALMFPMAEMAGPAHCIFLPHVTYVYHLETSGEWTGGDAFREEERKCVEYVRWLPKYERIESI